MSRPTLADTSSVWYHRWCIFIVIFIVMISLQLWLQWFWLLLYAALIIPFAPWQSIPMRFYRRFSLRARACIVLLQSSHFNIPPA